MSNAWLILSGAVSGVEAGLWPDCSASAAASLSRQSPITG